MSDELKQAVENVEKCLAAFHGNLNDHKVLQASMAKIKEELNKKPVLSPVKEVVSDGKKTS